MAANKYYYAVGRRKSSTATLKLYPNGKGKITITANGKQSSFLDYLGGRKYLVEDALSPFQVIKKDFHKKFDAELVVHGGGIAGQTGAIRLAFARALTDLGPDYRLTLKPYGLLQRDPRVKERKKPGRLKARKKPTWSKR